MGEGCKRQRLNMTNEFEPRVEAPRPDGDPVLWFAFQGGRMLVQTGASAELPRAAGLEQFGMRYVRSQYLGVLNGSHCYSAEIAGEVEAPPGMEWHGLRSLFGRFDDVLVAVASRAFQVMDWDRTHQFCGACGTPTVPRAAERARQCPSCGVSSYPRICPAMMVLITRGRELLLARKPAFPQGRYSALAGFVEAGEDLEQTVAREAYEEVGVEVGRLRYFGSQSWPFPNSLMIAFTAEHAGGEIRPDGVEIEDARWFDVDALPNLPDRISISRWMIDATCARLREEYPR